MREQYITGDDGQPVRAMHVYKVQRGHKQLFLWADIRHFPRKAMEASFAQRREQIVGECRQLDRDKRFWNNLHPEESPIQLLFDFTEDVDEGRFSGEYRPRNPR